MQLPTPELCRATIPRLPPSQRPVVMPMPSSSVLRVITRVASSLRQVNSRLVNPPSGIVQTVEMSRIRMAACTSEDQSYETGACIDARLGGRISARNREQHQVSDGSVVALRMRYGAGCTAVCDTSSKASQRLWSLSRRPRRDGGARFRVALHTPRCCGIGETDEYYAEGCAWLS